MIDPNLAFYNQVAKHCGKDELTSEEGDIVFHTRMAATSSYERLGITAPPANQIGQIVWLLTQDRLYREELRND